MQSPELSADGRFGRGSNVHVEGREGMQRRKLTVSMKRASSGLRLVLLGAAAIIQAPWAHASGSPVADAARTGDLDQVVELIGAGADVNLAQNDGTSALLWAAYQSDADMVSRLIAAGADVNAANNFGMTPLLEASRMGDAPVIAALLEGGADLERAKKDGETPLMAAARSGHTDSVKLLLEHGADPNAVEDYHSQTALMWAAAEGHLDVVDMLLNAGADPNMQARVSELTKRSVRTDFPTGGFTALMFAARNGDEAMIRRLVAGGADLDLTNGDGATAMAITIVNDRFDLAAKLVELGADVNDGSLYRAVEMRDATTDWLAQDGTRWRADHPNELNALDLTRILLEAGADPNKPLQAQNHSSSMCCDTFANGTPFFRAAVAADVAAMQLLIEHGADLEWALTKADDAPGPANKDVGKTPLMVAMDGGKGVGMAGGPGDIREDRPPPFREEADREPIDAVKLLLEAGANPDAVTPDGDSALHIAAREGKLDMIRLLADAGATLDLANNDGKTALDLAENPPPKKNGPPMPGADKAAKPEEVAALLRELMQVDGGTQANLSEGDAQ